MTISVAGLRSWPRFRWRPFSPAWFMASRVWLCLCVCIFSLFIWLFAWITFHRTGFGLVYHGHLFTFSYCFSQSVTQGEEQIMWANCGIAKAVVLHIVIPTYQSYKNGFIWDAVSLHFLIIVIKKDQDRGVDSKPAFLCSHSSQSFSCFFYQSPLTQTYYYITFSKD